MKTTILSTILVAALASPAYADLTLKQTTTGRGLGMRGKTSGTTYIKAARMRTDVVDGDKTLTTIFDLDAQKMYSFDSKKKEAEVWDMAALAADLSKTIDTSRTKASLTPNGQTKTIAGQTATGYTLDVSMPAGAGGSNDMTMMVSMSGPVWIVKGAPGSADYAAFYNAAAEKGFIFTNPSAAKGAPGQARAITEMYRQFAETGGIAYETDTQIRMGAAAGGNPLGGLLGRLGTVSMASVIESVETGSLPDDLFAPPAGYKLNQKK
jgi:hypothetical protein